MNKKFFIVMLSVLLLLPSLSASGNTRTPASAQVPSVEPRRLITVGADQNYPPFEFVDDHGRPAGFNIELLRALGDVMGLSFEIRSGSWSSIRQALENGHLDMASGMFYSEARDEKVDFSEPFIIVLENMFVRENSMLAGIDNLKNKEIIVQSGDIMHDFVLSSGLTGSIVEVYNPIDGLRLLSSGRHDAVLLPKLQGQYLLNKYNINNLKVAGQAILAQQLCFAVAEGDSELAVILDRGLGILKASGKYDEIREQWFGVIERNKFEALYKIVTVVLICLFLLLTASWLWNGLLSRHVRRKTRELAKELTAHEHTLETLKDREAHLQAIVESSSDAILVLDKQARMTDCNPALISQLGYERHAIIGQPVSLLFSQEEDTHLLERRVFSDIEKKGAWQDECLLVDKSGRRVPMDITMSEKILPDGHLEGYVVIMRNISKRKQAEEENVRLENQLRQVLKMEAIGTLAAGISHDFNNILSSIIGYTELSRRALDVNSQARKDLDEVLDSADRAKRLVRQILTYSRQAEQERRPERLVALVEDSLRLLKASLPATIEIFKNFRVEDDLVLADATQINQMVINLVTNAVHAMDAGRGRLDIKLRDIELSSEEAAMIPASSSGRYLELTIADNGHGIDKSHIERIFDPFFTTKQRGEGTGMGLSVVHGIIKDHGGFIRVESELDVGTVFQVVLPWFDGVSDEAPLPGPILGGSERILLIDDEEKVANAWRRILMSLGYFVSAVIHPTDGLGLFQSSSENFDLVVTDLDMPGMTGLELTGHLKEIRPDIPVILYTGFSTTLNEVEAKRLGVSRILYKPVSTTSMADALRKVLDERKNGGDDEGSPDMDGFHGTDSGY